MCIQIIVTKNCAEIKKKIAFFFFPKKYFSVIKNS